MKFMHDMTVEMSKNFNLMKESLLSLMYNADMPVENQTIIICGFTSDTLPFASMFASMNHKLIFTTTPPIRIDISTIYDYYQLGARLCIINDSFKPFMIEPAADMIFIYTSPNTFTSEVAEFVTHFRWISMTDMLTNIRKHQRLDLAIKFATDVKEMITSFTDPNFLRERWSSIADNEQSQSFVNNFITNMSYSADLDKRKQNIGICGLTKSDIIPSFMFDVMNDELIEVSNDQLKDYQFLDKHKIRIIIIDKQSEPTRFENGPFVTYAYIHKNEIDVQFVSLIAGIKWMNVLEIIQSMRRQGRTEELKKMANIINKVDL